jgi:hypothetical protein
MLPPRINAALVVGGRYHDMDYARLQLLEALGVHDQIRVRVFEDYRDIDAIMAADLLVTYTVDVVPEEATALRLREWLAAGHRWLALHGTNSVLRWSKAAKAWEAPRDRAAFMQTVGSQFLSHPPIAPLSIYLQIYNMRHDTCALLVAGPCTTVRRPDRDATGSGPTHTAHTRARARDATRRSARADVQKRPHAHGARYAHHTWFSHALHVQSRLGGTAHTEVHGPGGTQRHERRGHHEG